MVWTSGTFRPNIVPKIKCASILKKFGTVNNQLPLSLIMHVKFGHFDF